MFTVALSLCFLCGAFARTQFTLESFTTKPRVFVLTDIAADPDDEMSLTPTTSTWLRDETFAWQIQEKVLEWGEVRDNLTKHAEGWPETEELLGNVYSGLPVYSADDPLWVPIWGGASVLAQVLWTVQNTRSQVAVADFVTKLRVYAISDQDDAGPWIRSRFPDLFYIASIHTFNMYSLATWPGISGELDDDFDVGGPDSSLVTNEWLDSNIRSSGSAFAASYPRFAYIMEGDTPRLHITGNLG
ncbi:uncharacterized protein EV420DRAFT_1524448 [Desarmillaria tabescens]|uniref:Cellulose-binding Sde182 nucleoside hydrolase-like domain-containing protein n=1 Tax=Armillaria tabescens TaxID=1929756 RepID=A0AA39NB66_ARMTA|nr:uncharacterized protein EV420DRAFT_1524448 [Desarmillaria tabescens]KAK0462384.1 hypothetical protein EV420DRAFT_1524448 [Desarmillaria tabescens]